MSTRPKKDLAVETTTQAIDETGYIKIVVAGGVVGPEGPPNAGVAIVGIANVWPPSKVPTKGDLYIIPEPPPAGAPVWATNGHGAFWDGTQWLDAGLLRGTQGDRGEPGPPLNVRGVANFWVPDGNPKPGDIWQLPEILPAGVPPEFKAGGAAAWDDTAKKWIPLEAIRGPAGHSVEIFGPSALPPLTGVEKGDLWLSTDPTLFAATFDPSTVTQVPGPPGPQGPAGPSAYDSWKLAVGRPGAPHDDFLAAITGAKGDKGDQGPAGQTFTVEGVVADVATLPAAPPRLTVYLVQQTGELWIYDPMSSAKQPNDWVNLGKIAGPPGQSAWLATPVDDVSKLPAAGTAGEMVYVSGSGHLYGWDDTNGAWVDGGRIGATGIDDGNAQGDMLVWDALNSRWSSRSYVPVVTGTRTGDRLMWNQTTGLWEAGGGNLHDLVDVSTTVPTDGQILAWDDTAKEWHPAAGISKLGDIGDVTFGVPPVSGQVVMYDVDHWISTMPRISGLGDVDLVTAPPVAGNVLSYDDNDGKWKPTVAAGSLAAMTDVDVVTTPPTAGQTIVWDATASKWVPGDSAGASPIVYLGTGAWDGTAALDGTDPMYGMPAGTTPSPTDYPPIPGDSYVDLATGLVTTFTGAVTTKRTGGAITGGGGGLDIIRERLQDLDDVAPTTPSQNNILIYDGGQNLWTPVSHEFASMTYVDNRVEALAIGLAHDVAVLSILNDPPSGYGNENLYYIVGTNPTGIWAGHANEIAHYTMGSGGSYDWHFESPRVNEAHLVEDQAATYTWSGTAWVKVASAQTGANINAASLYQVGDIKQSILTETQFRTMLGTQEADKWALADGRNVSGSDYTALTGNTNVPDLRGGFLRMAGQNSTNVAWNGGSLGDYQEDSTARPKSAFTGSTNSNGSHTHTSSKKKTAGASGNIASANITAGDGYNAEWGTITNAAGSHSHTVTINGGGDEETRPKNYGVNFFIKVRA